MGSRDDGQGPLDRVKWALTTDDERVAYVRELLGSVLAVVMVGVVLFAVSGVWPPMVAIESGSMDPNLQRGDLVFVMEEHRFPGPGAHVADEPTGVVPNSVGAQPGGYTKFGAGGDVIVYERDGNGAGTPVIHRAMFWVNESENWYDKANPDYLGSASDCEELRNCPAPHAGFVTKGDNDATNPNYDQVAGISGPVRPDWVVGTAELRIPKLGCIRLVASGQAGPGCLF
jgi:signal peptidase